MGRSIGKVNEVTKTKLCLACRMADHGLTREDRLRNCPYKNKPCPTCKVKGHLPVSGWCITPRTGKAKEEGSPREGTLSSGGRVGLISNAEESGVFTIHAGRLSEVRMDTDHYDGRWEENQDKVYSYDPEGEYDTDTDTEYDTDTEADTETETTRNTSGAH